MYRKILSFVLLFVYISSLCYAADLSVETLIRGVNQARLTIQSGELHAETITEHSATKTEAEIVEWIKTEKERELKNFHLGIDVKQYENDFLIPRLNADAERFRQHTKQELTTALFHVLEMDNATRPRQYQYKLTKTESPRSPLDSMSDRFKPSDTFYLLTYDMQIQVKELIGNIIHAVQHFSFFDTDRHYGYFHFSLFGRSLFHVPSDAKLVGKETIDGAECYTISFITSDNRRKIHIGIDPAKDFCVRRIDFYPLQAAKTPFARITYNKFRKVGDFWFPHVSVDTNYKRDSTIRSRSTTEVIDVILNVDFPKDLFEIDKKHYGLPDTGRAPDQGASPANATGEFDTSLLLCGPQSLSRICELLKVNTNLSELKKLSGFTPDRGTTMLGLKKAATYKYLAPAGVKASVELLKRKKVPLPAIAYVNNSHFLVFEDVSKVGVKITDPAQKYGPQVTWDELTNIWSGELLIFNKKKMHRNKQENVPLAFSEKPIFDFGKALGGSKIEHTFIIKNIGKKPLEIISVTETCVCTASVLSQDEILPGKTGSISTVLTVPTGNGQINESLHVLTNDPIQNTITLSMKGEAFTPLKTFPELIALGTQKPLKNTLTKQISLHLQEDTEIQSVRTNSKDIKATLKMRDKIPFVDIQFLSTLPVGKVSHHILVHYTYKGEPATHKISAIGEIIGELRVTPNRLFFGLIKDTSSFSKTITISSRDMQPFEVISTESSTKSVNVTIANNPNEKHYQLTATISPDAKSGEVSGEIVINTSSSVQPTVRVPFFGIITESN